MGSVSVENLSVEFPTARGIVRAVERVDVEVHDGEILALVGESGCGKSTLAFSLMRLIPPPGRIAGGRMIVNGTEITRLNGRDLRRFRGEQIAMVFQASMDSFNPVVTFQQQLNHILESHPGVWASVREAHAYFRELLALVHLPPEVLRAFPHELSGGMKQRMAIAFALALKPQVLVLDEPTTALDVVSQHLVLEILRDLHRKQEVTIVFVTHDLSIVAEIATHVAVMYAGTLVEWGDVDSVFYAAERHPYVSGLLASVPSVTKSRSEVKGIPGSVPDLLDEQPGCRFANRCPIAVAHCRVEEPAMLPAGPQLRIRCPEVLGTHQGGERSGSTGS